MLRHGTHVGAQLEENSSRIVEEPEHASNHDALRGADQRSDLGTTERRRVEILCPNLRATSVVARDHALWQPMGANATREARSVIEPNQAGRSSFLD